MPYILMRPARILYGMIPYERKLGRSFRETYRFLREAREWTREKREEHQMDELGRLIDHAYTNVPYYRKVFDERGLTPRSIQCFEDLAKLPYLTKDLIRENIDHLLAINYKSHRAQYKVTGGTTGIPLGFYDEKGVSEAREWAFIATLWSAFGYDINKRNRSVILRGVLPATGYFEHKGLNLILSSTMMQEEYLDDYVRLLTKFDPDYIQAYPSAIWILSNYIVRNGINIRLKNLKAVICSSEVLYDFQRKKIDDAFHTRVYSFYGHSERSCLAGECEISSDYHLVSEYGVTELINRSGDNVSAGDEAGEIVCTGFNNYVMPFIRYRTGDIGVRSDRECGCGRNYELLKEIKGRMQDFFIDKRGDSLSFIFQDEALWQVRDKITAYRYVQEEPGKVRLDIEDKGRLDGTDMQFVKSEFNVRYPSLEVEVRTVKEIERTNSGKFRFLVQNTPSK